MRPRIALTLGDPAGVGPEIILKMLLNRELHSQCDLIVFGEPTIVDRCRQHLGLTVPDSLKIDRFDLNQWQKTASHWPGGLAIVDVGSIGQKNFSIGQVSPLCGQASYDYIQAAIDSALRNEVSAIATAPINKEAMHRAGIKYPGHTEIFADRAQASRWCMMQYSEILTCSFVTVHVGYAEVPRLLTIENVFDTIELTRNAMLRLRNKEPHLVVCGLNPHAGEHGLFGDREEERIIVPAIERARNLGMHVEGPLPPDTAFVPWKRSSTDAFICMYHDQGHIPVKALAFDCSVNTTLGLRILRTSVDHGTAFDIAWQGRAQTSSMEAAIKLAIRLSIDRS